MLSPVDYERGSGAGLRVLPCLVVVGHVSGGGRSHRAWCPGVSVAAHQRLQRYLCSPAGAGRVVWTFSFPHGRVERTVDASGASAGICESGSTKSGGFV